MTTRRSYLKGAGGALLAATALPFTAKADGNEPAGDVFYGHGMVWNRDLPGVAGELNLAFDLRLNLETGTGAGSATDGTHPEWNVDFTISSVQAHRKRKGTRYVMKGEVVRANDPSNVGLEVIIVAETRGEATAIAIGLGDLTFSGAGLVVIAIIAILIPLLVPAVQKVREAR